MVNRLIDIADDLQCDVRIIENGCTVVDAGLNSPGCEEAGRLIAEACMGGLGVVRSSHTCLAGMRFPAVVVGVNRPSTATLGSQMASWQLKIGGFTAIASGPARALANVETDVYSRIEHHEESELGMVALDTRDTPTATITSEIASLCGISPSNLFCAVVPSASAAGALMNATRVVEFGIRTMSGLGIQPEQIRAAHGVSVIAPVPNSDSEARSLAAKCVCLGGRTYLSLRTDGTADLADLMRAYESDGCRYDGEESEKVRKTSHPILCLRESRPPKPAELTVTDIHTRTVFRAGEVNENGLRNLFTQLSRSNDLKRRRMP
ncbi:MAG: methenyltetrahydromethanopterin cyclohydrolase [Candidatus Thorarchaeota archaeon]